MKKSLPIIREDAIWIRIKNFFRKIFYKEIKTTNLSNTCVNEYNSKKYAKKNVSFSQMAQEKSKRYNYLLGIQKDLELGKIKEEDLNENDVKELKIMYLDQIEVLKRKINQKKRLIS